jgi:F-type H+-transporting ATPase subunit delta
MDTAANRESYGIAADRVAAFAAGADPSAVYSVADELLSIADLLRREPRLRRALSDTARPSDSRVELLGSLLSGKVSDDALALAGALVEGRWSSPVELLNATERLGVDGLLTAADRAGDLGDVEDELFRFGQIVGADHPLAAALGDSSADVSRRQELIDALLEGKAKPATVRLAKLALAGFGGRSFDASLTRLVELAAAKRELTVAYVTSAIALSDDEEQRLATRLAGIYGRDVSLLVDVDPRIIGGMRVKVGSDLYDGTVARRLAEARTAIAK